MPDPPSFDPTHAVRFDLAEGRVLRDEGQRYLVVPVEALEELALARAGGDAVEVVSRAFGASMGRRIAARFAAKGGARAATVEEFVGHLGGELAISGCGVLRVERWGRALVLALEQAPLPDAILAPMLEAALAEAAGRELRCTVIARDAAVARVLVSSDPTGRRVRAWLAEGVPWGDALTKLHEKDGAA